MFYSRAKGSCGVGDKTILMKSGIQPSFVLVSFFQLQLHHLTVGDCAGTYSCLPRVKIGSLGKPLRVTNAAQGSFSGTVSGWPCLQPDCRSDCPILAVLTFLGSKETGSLKLEHQETKHYCPEAAFWKSRHHRHWRM